MDAAWMTTIVTWLTMSIRMSIPLLFPSLGGLISQKAGVFNFGLEGMMLCGAYFGYYGSYVTGSPWIGLLLGMISNWCFQFRNNRISFPIDRYQYCDFCCNII